MTSAQQPTAAAQALIDQIDANAKELQAGVKDSPEAAAQSRRVLASALELFIQGTISAKEMARVSQAACNTNHTARKQLQQLAEAAAPEQPVRNLRRRAPPGSGS